MRNWILAGMLIAVAPAVRADDAAEILAKAVKASAGSEEALAKRKFMHMKLSGVVHFPDGAAVTTREMYLALPERAKWIDESKPATGPRSVIAVLNGLRGWAKMGKVVADLAPTQYDAVQNEAYTLWIASLVPFKSKSIRWELLKDGSVDGRPTRVLKSTQAGRPIVNLHFDRDSHLLLKAAYAGTENLQPTSKEFVFSAHRDFEGQRLPGKVQVYQNGKKIEEWTSDSVRFLNSLDDKTFAKP
jgi:hypothetical protein